MKVINIHKFSRVYCDPDVYHCDVRATIGDQCVFGQGLYLRGFLYFNLRPNEFYRIKEKEFGRYPLNIMFRKIHLVHPLGVGKWRE